MPPQVSVDTYHPETARRAVALGAAIINCVYAEPVPEMLSLLNDFPRTELVMPACCWNLVSEDARLVPRIYLDPMIGFGTTREEDLELLRGVPALAEKSNQYVSAIMKVAIESGQPVHKYTDKRRTYFAYGKEGA